jgi:hypothetical protein
MRCAAVVAGLKDGTLQPGYAGISPKLSAKGAPAMDFVVQAPGVHDVEGLVNLFRTECPGLTSAIAIRDLVPGWVNMIDLDPTLTITGRSNTPRSKRSLRGPSGSFAPRGGHTKPLQTALIAAIGRSKPPAIFDVDQDS